MNEVEIRYWTQVKYLMIVLNTSIAGAGALYVLMTPAALNRPSVLIICLALFAGAILFLTVPVPLPAVNGTRPVVYGIWAILLAVVTTVLCRLDYGLISPFVALYVIAIVIAGATASRACVVLTGATCLAGFIWLHPAFGVPVTGSSFFVAAMLVLVLLSSTWLATTQEHRAQWLAALADELATQAATVAWVLEATPAGISISDADDRLVVANAAACAMLGRPWEELIGAPAHDTYHHSHPDGTPFPKEECGVQAALRTGHGGPTTEDVYWRADGTSFDVETKAVPTPDGGVMVAFADISERLATQRLKDEFMSVVSHELRTPLTSVRGALGLLAGGAVGDLPPHVKNMVAIASSNTDRLSRLINNILDVERIKSGQAVLQPESLNAASVAAAAVAEMRVMAAEQGVDLRCVGTEVMVHADRDRVQQVIVNLLSNAVKFSEPGSEVVVTTLVDGREARIDVTDHGRGIPKELSEHIFARFQQVDASDARVMGGAGLGLAICEGIVRQHGGRIWVDSTVGVGSTFSFTLPLATVTAPGTDDHKLVLVIDSDSEARRSISQALDDGGYRALGAATGSQGLALAASEHPVAVLLDADLADMDAWDVVHSLRTDSATSTVAIILFGSLTDTHKTHPSDAVEAFIDRTTLYASVLPAVDHALHDARTGPVVLIVEDDVDLAEVLAAGFRGRGVETAIATSWHAAKEWCEATTPDVVLLDLILPDGCGANLVSWLRETGMIDQVGLAVYTALDVDSEHRIGMGLSKGDLFVKSRIPPEVVLNRVLQLLDNATPAKAVSLS